MEPRLQDKTSQKTEAASPPHARAENKKINKKNRAAT
jgi:hypothetical protein